MSQDELGDRRKCEHAVKRALEDGQHVVVDRTNIDQHQRSHWLRIGRKMRLPPAAVAAVMLDVDVNTCKQSIMSRAFHPTLKAEPYSLEIIDRFVGNFQRPSEHEGFGCVVRLDEGDSLSRPDIIQDILQ